MVQQTEFRLSPRRRGCHLITREIFGHLPAPMPRAGLLNIFVKHTSCALTINENADPDVLTDLDAILDRVVPDSQPYYSHTLEGPDDMSAHAKSTLAGVSLTIPVTDGRLNLGMWQGIYLCEFRDHATPRTIVLTLIS
ncbi:MAG: secondary thiamine-phosphate synthase enzyme YjbQ [Muribaculaceae bacterium]|nr:secondary thiamine-phosphate synthase enzyme YjbQ [Muribaculaceae bacterium]